MKLLLKGQHCSQIKERYGTEEASRAECAWYVRNPFYGGFLSNTACKQHGGWSEDTKARLCDNTVGLGTG